MEAVILINMGTFFLIYGIYPFISVCVAIYNLMVIAVTDFQCWLNYNTFGMYGLTLVYVFQVTPYNLCIYNSYDDIKANYDVVWNFISTAALHFLYALFSGYVN